MKHVLETHPSQLCEEEVLVLVYQLHVLYKSHVLRPLCLNSTHTAPLHLTSKQFADVWCRTIDRKIVAGLGDAAGTVAPKKCCGSLLDAVTSELDVQLKKKKQTEITSIVDVLDVLSSQRITEWHANYFPTLGATFQSEKIKAERVS
jgi:hypothetical protein